MPERQLPVRPDLIQLRNQAKDLLHGLHRGDADAIAEFREFHPGNVEPASAKLASPGAGVQSDRRDLAR